MKRILLCLLLCVLIGAGAFRMASYADERETTLSQEEQKQQEALERAAYAREQAETLRRDLEAIQVQADALLEENRTLTAQIAENKSMIQFSLQEFQAAEAELEKQRESMALRIQFHYEQEQSSFLDILTGARSLSEILNNAEYIRSLAEYDRQLLDWYALSVEEAKRSHQAFLDKESELISLLGEIEEKQTAYQETVSSMLGKIEEYQTQMADYETEAAEYQEEINATKARLEAARAAAEKAAQEAARRKAEEEEARRLAEANAAAEEAARRAQEEADRLAAEEARIQAEREEEARRLAAEAEKASQEAEEAARLESEWQAAQAAAQEAEQRAREAAEAQAAAQEAASQAQAAAEQASREAAEAEASRAQAEAEAAQQASREAAEQSSREAAEQASREAAEQASREAAAAQAEAEAQAAREAASRAAEEASQAQEEASQAQASVEQKEEEIRDTLQVSDSLSIAFAIQDALRRSNEIAAQAAVAMARASNARGVGTLDIDPYAINPSGYSNLRLLAAIIDCEAGGQPYEGRVAVGNVIFYRIASAHFQTNLYDVIYAPNQFTPAYTGLLEVILAMGPRQSSYDAAMACFNGVRTIPSQYLYFSGVAYWPALQIACPDPIRIDGHIFYYYP